MPPAPRTCRCWWPVVHQLLGSPWKACGGRGVAVPLCTGIIAPVILARYAPPKKILTTTSACKYVYSMPLQVVCLTVRMRIVWMTGSIIRFYHGCGKRRWRHNWHRFSKNFKNSNLCFKIWDELTMRDKTGLQLHGPFIQLIDRILSFACKCVFLSTPKHTVC